MFADMPSPPPTRRQRQIALLLRFHAAILLSAVGAVFLPTSWMAAVHQRLGMGELPTEPVVIYMARSLAILYALRGAIALFLSFDVAGYRTLIQYWALLTLTLGTALLLVDLVEGMPILWTLAEGPTIAALGIAYLLLLRDPVD